MFIDLYIYKKQQEMKRKRTLQTAFGGYLWQWQEKEKKQLEIKRADVRWNRFLFPIQEVIKDDSDT